MRQMRPLLLDFGHHVSTELAIHAAMPFDCPGEYGGHIKRIPHEWHGNPVHSRVSREFSDFGLHSFTSHTPA